MAQPAGIVPFPLPEVRRAAVQELVGQGDVVIEVLAVRELDAAYRVATAE